LENALLLQCDFSHAHLDGVQASGCNFTKCDLSGADLSGGKLVGGALRKCRLNSTDLTGTNLYAANLQGLIMNSETRFDGANLKRTLLAGREEALKDAFRNS
ncbi:MAG: pentapeptide repeat-containing protein, partial [Desulfovibrionaceae bacterium]|nr:pentapeptide repeat-containing protein [Desulfovibrionaceae bacterium]